jgi:NO-binding membrane sensor protein with MHYT domain
MHFIGNQALVMEPNRSAHRIAYSTAFTAVSFFLPIIVLFVAFYILGTTDRPNRYYITTAGILAGTAICGMHYVGQLGISNYDCTYRIPNLIGAAVIAAVASVIALGVFFRLRESWTDSWWERSLCGAGLACAVSGMHWTATIGTTYTFKRGNAIPGSQSQISTIVVSTILSVLACVILLCFALVATRKKQIYKTRAQQLVLACAYFDEAGRVMVTAQGGLPCTMITNHYIEKVSFDRRPADLLINLYRRLVMMSLVRRTQLSSGFSKLLAIGSPSRVSFQG